MYANCCYFSSCTFKLKCNRLYLVSIKVTVMDKWNLYIAMFCVCGGGGGGGGGGMGEGGGKLLVCTPFFQPLSGINY